MIYQKQKELYASLTQSLPLILPTFKPQVEPPHAPPSMPLIANNQVVMMHVHMQQLKTLLAEQSIQSDIVNHIDNFFKGLNPDPQTVSTLLREKQAIQQAYATTHKNGQDAVSCESHCQDIWEAMFPWSQFSVSALTSETSVNTGRLLQRMAQMMNVSDNMEENKKVVWRVSRQCTQQAVNLANNHLHFFEQREVLLRELHTQCYSEGCN